MSDTEKKILHEFYDIPVCEKPFLAIAQKTGIKEKEVINIAKRFENENIIRRFGASLSHREVGFSENGMVTFSVSEEEVEGVGEKIASLPFVTHCYERVGLPYNIFAMVHGRSKEEVEQKAHQIEEACGRKIHKVFYSTKQYKKTSLRY